MVGADDTWQRLSRWSNGQAHSEWLAAHVLQGNGYTRIDPTHPRGGPDGTKDAIAYREDKRWVMAVYFPPSGQQSIGDITKKFSDDLAGVSKNNAVGLAFVTNQELTDSQRKSLHALAEPHAADLFHIERVRLFLDDPVNQGLREQFLAIGDSDPADTYEQVSHALEQFRSDQSQRHSEIQETLRDIRSSVASADDFRDVAERLPPTIRESTVAALTRTPRAAGLIRKILDESSAQSAIPTLEAPPSWLSNAQEDAWAAIAEVATLVGSYDDALKVMDITSRESDARREYWKARKQLYAYWARRHDAANDALPAITTTSDHPLGRTIVLLESGRYDEARSELQSWEAPTERDRDLQVLLLADLLASQPTPDWPGALAAVEPRIDETNSSNVLLLGASLLQRRAHLRLGDNYDADFDRAYSLAVRARDMKRAWKGDSSKETALAADIAMLRGDWASLARITTAAPLGEATTTEANSTDVRAKAAMAAASHGDLERARELATSASPFDKAWLEATIAETEQITAAPALPNVGAAIAQWSTAWDLAESEEQRVIAVRGLMSVGATLSEEQQSLLSQNPHARELAELALEATPRGGETATMFEARLRGAARTNKFAAIRVADILAYKNDAEAGVSVLQRAADEFQDQRLRLLGVSILERAGDLEGAPRVARAVLSLTGSSYPGRARAVRALHLAAHDAGRWVEAAEHARTLLGIDPSDARARWWLAMALSNGGSPEDAWLTLTRDRAYPTPASFDEELFLLKLEARFGPTEDLVRHAAKLARENFEDEKKLAQVLQIALAVGGSRRGSEADAKRDLDTPLQELREAAESFFDRFPESETGFIRATLDPVDPLASINALLVEGAAARTARLKDLAEPGLPIGGVCPTAGRRYGEVLLEPLNPVWMISSADDAARAQDLEELRSAIEAKREVVVDPSVLRTISTLQRTHLPTGSGLAVDVALPESLRQRFSSILSDMTITDAALQDILSTRESYDMRSTLSLIYDHELGQMRPQRIDQGRIDELRQRAQELLNLARNLDVRAASYVDPRAGQAFMESWIGNVDFARKSGLALWCDDLPLRNVARSLGVLTFSTVEVAHQAQSAGAITAEEEAGIRLGLLVGGASYLAPTHQELRTIAQAQIWTPRSVALLISDPVLWSTSSESAFSIYTEAMERCSHDIEAMTAWSYQACFGLSRATSSDGAGLSVLLARIMIRESSSPMTVAAAEGGLRFSAPNLRPTVWTKAIQEAYSVYLRLHNEAEASQILLKLVGQCPTDARLEALRTVLGSRE